jgi:hypothetical protein
MANLRGGVTPDRRGEATRLSSKHIHVWANTWTRTVTVDLGKDGRASITVMDGHKTVLEVELPDNEGENVDSLAPVIHLKSIDLTPAIIAELLGRPEEPIPVPLLGET